MSKNGTLRVSYTSYRKRNIEELAERMGLSAREAMYIAAHDKLEQLRHNVRTIDAKPKTAPLPNTLY